MLLIICYTCLTHIYSVCPWIPHTHTHIYIYIYIYIYMYICIYVCMYIYTYIYIYICVCVCAVCFRFVYTYIQMWAVRLYHWLHRFMVYIHMYAQAYVALHVYAFLFILRCIGISVWVMQTVLCDCSRFHVFVHDVHTMRTHMFTCYDCCTFQYLSNFVSALFIRCGLSVFVYSTTCRPCEFMCVSHFCYTLSPILF